MTRIAKLYAQMLRNPRGLTFAEFQKLLEAFGYRLVQPKGNMAKPYQASQFLDMIEVH